MHLRHVSQLNLNDRDNRDNNNLNKANCNLTKNNSSMRKNRGVIRQRTQKILYYLTH